MKRYIIYIALCLVAAASCEQLPEQVKIYGVGCKMNEVSLGVDAGEYALEVYADGEFTASLDEDDTWIRFSDFGEERSVPGNGDMTINFTFDINKGIPRTAVLTLTRGTNVFELSLVQDGILEGGLDIEQKNISISSVGGQFGAKVITKLKEDDLSFDVTYKEEDDVDWISGLGLNNNFICFDVKANLSSRIRHAVITVRYEGKAGLIQVLQFYDGCQTETVGVSGLKALFDGNGDHEIDTHLVLEGVVINDNVEKNGAENRMVSLDAQDLNFADRVLYVQDEEGSAGIKLMFKESCADIVTRFDRISVDLQGAVLKREAGPERYSIDKIPTSAIISTMAGDDIQPKQRTLEELSDEDIFTLVTLKDVQIPVRKGSYAPLDIRYVATVVSYPMVIRSRGGATSHMMVNIDCPWSRDGHELPEGSGSITGVIVHETCDNFEWDAAKERELVAAGVTPNYITGLGRIGDYQIRPVRKSDIDLAEDNFSTILYEWAYCDSLGVNLVNNYEEQTLYPTYSSELETASSLEDLKSVGAGFYCMGADGEKVPLRLCNDFTHLGPYTFGGRITEPSNGNGIYDYMGRSAHWDPYGSTATIGVLFSYYASNAKNRWSAESHNGDGSNGSAWCVPGWDTEKYWCAEFSTEGLSADNGPLSITFGTMNHINALGAPRYWQVEYSKDGEDWTEAGGYTVPDFVYTAGIRIYQLPGTKFITMSLPYELLGAQKVYVRMKPASAKAGNASSYDGASKITSSSYNAINYFAIRYNN